jgi:hypothetical protein
MTSSKAPTPAFKCAECGNFRALLPAACDFCGSCEPAIALKKYWRIDIHSDRPLVDAALQQLDENIEAAAAAGLKGLIVIHGFGSTGSGGDIKHALRDQLAGNRWSHRVGEYAGGEDITPHSSVHSHWLKHRSELINLLKQNHDLGNTGLTVLLLRNQSLKT